MRKALIVMSAALCLLLGGCGSDLEQTAAAPTVPVVQSAVTETRPTEIETEDPEPTETEPETIETATECCTDAQIDLPPGCCAAEPAPAGGCCG